MPSIVSPAWDATESKPLIPFIITTKPVALFSYIEVVIERPENVPNNNSIMIDILDRISLFDTLGKLQADQKPIFGAMTPQHMVEHLAFAVRFSNGKEPQQQHFPAATAQKIKAFVVGTDHDMPAGFKSPVLPAEGLPALKSSDLSKAIDNLKDELDEFDHYFTNHPSHKPINPTMGELDYQEWVRFHNRHFSHHFRQFGLM